MPYELDRLVRYEKTLLESGFNITTEDESLFLAEYEPLRNEVNHTLDRLSGNENVCGAAVFAGIVAQHTLAVFPSAPDYVFQVPVSIVVLGIAVGGKVRADTFRRHSLMLGKYLSFLERKVAPNVGWSNFYRDAMSTSPIARHMGTRDIYWHVIKFVSLLNLIITIGVLAVSK